MFPLLEFSFVACKIGVMEPAHGVVVGNKEMVEREDDRVRDYLDSDTFSVIRLLFLTILSSETK